MNVILLYPKTPISVLHLEDIFRMRGTKVPNPPLGILTVAAFLPKDWNLKLFDLNVCDLTEQDWEWADVVMISGMIVHRDGMLSLIRESKERGKKVVVGGPYATSVPEQVLEAGCDVLFKGEAEDSIHRLISALEEGQEQGVFERDGNPLMTESPVPRYDLLKLSDYAFMTLQISRGCPYDCEFCDIVNLFGRKTRYKTPDQVTEELETLYNLGWKNLVFIVDDNFVGSKTRAREILHAMIAWNERRGKPFRYWCQLPVNVGQDQEMLDLMTEANFVYVYLGVEHPDEDVLKSVDKGHNVRNPIVESLFNINKSGLAVVAGFVLGFDGESKGVGERICEFVEKTGTVLPLIGTLTALPNSRLWARLREEGRLVDDVGYGAFSEGYLNFSPTRPESEILEEYLQAWDYLYEPSRFLARVYRQHRAMDPVPKSQSVNEWSRLTINEARILMHHVWRHGIIASHRWQFWRQLFGVLFKNPTRFGPYIECCIIGLALIVTHRRTLKDVALSLERRKDADKQPESANEPITVTEAIEP